MAYLNDNLAQGEREKMSDADYIKYRSHLIKNRLNELSEDIIQYQCGALIMDIDERKREFAALHNELRNILGKEPRVYY
jgi:hypothetical protein